MRTEFYIKQVTWSTHAPALRWVRETVFIDEQAVPEPLEWDDQDEKAVHLLAFDEQEKAVACARLLDNGSIGRMAVSKQWRGKGVGKALLAAAVEYFQAQNFQRITLSAQQHAITFYEQAGFEVSSEPYLDANILHVDMQLDI